MGMWMWPKDQDHDQDRAKVQLASPLAILLSHTAWPKTPPARDALQLELKLQLDTKKKDQ